MTKTLTLEEVRAGFVRRGESQSEWARRHNVNRVILCDILNGRRSKYSRGQSHRIAVLLGIKDGEIFLPNLLGNPRKES